MTHPPAAPVAADLGVMAGLPAANWTAAPDACPILFLDFEASSLSARSWPIEIGYAWIADRRVEVASTLIAPAPGWPLDDWSERSARVHGLTLQEVRTGIPAAAAAALTEPFRDFLVVSDNPRWDQAWLDRLRGPRPRIRVRDVRDAVADRLSPPAADVFAINLLRSRCPHRAGGDAARLADAWLAATEWEALAA